MTSIRQWTVKVVAGAAIVTVVLALGMIDLPFMYTVWALVIGMTTIIFGVVLASVGVWQWVFQGVDREAASDVDDPDVLSLRRTIPGVLYATVAHVGLVPLSMAMGDDLALRIVIPQWIAVVGLVVRGRELPTRQQRCVTFVSFVPMVATMTFAMAHFLLAYYLLVLPGDYVLSAMGMPTLLSTLLPIGVIVAAGPIFARLAGLVTPRLATSLALAGIAVSVAATMFFTVSASVV